MPDGLFPEHLKNDSASVTDVSAATEDLRVLHVITGLNVGGAERMLHKLLVEHSKRNVRSFAVSLTDNGEVGRQIQRLGVKVQVLGLRRALPNPVGIYRLAKVIRNLRPQVIQSWMYHADLAAGLAGRMIGDAPVIWNIRNSNLDPESKRLTRLTARLCARLSGVLPEKIICCSEASKREHVRLGYQEANMQVIPNGFDPAEFKPDDQSKAAIRRELNVEYGVPLIGLVARYDPQKDFLNFVRAAKLFLKLGHKATFIMVGEGVDSRNVELTRLIQQYGILHSVRLLGPRDDIARVTGALDIATSSSRCNEGFSNTVGEAMACAVPCVVTDVGDSRHIVGETGIVVPPEDSQALAKAWIKLLGEGEEKKKARGSEARRRIVEKFSIAQAADQYLRVYQQATTCVRV